MSIDTRLNPGLAQLGALERQALEGRQPGAELPALDAPATVGAEVEPVRLPAVDEGETLLNAAAWDADGGARLFVDGFRPGGSDRGQDLETGVEATVDALA